eukprot:TRINITY_DN7027_c0_g1_i1.p1 TRINITY_DN7027_c0_g1~~TRINITY_DN7027_c0_g1_i1.p1  ORF type:complete len:348 (-),score=62.52 TRINITY_DN7027_c0_g1_i1:789-1832(-)
MTGMEFLQNLNPEQIAALPGGKVLQEYQSPVPFQKRLSKPTSKFRIALESSGITVPLFILMAQRRSTIVRDTTTSHLKVAGDLVDKCHGTLVQYTNFLNSHIPAGEIAKQLRSPYDLQGKYRLDTAVSFSVLRNLFREDAYGEQSVEALASLPKFFRHALPSVNGSPKLYTTFWSLGLDDIEFPEDLYTESISSLTKEISDFQAPPDMKEPIRRKVIREKKDMLDDLKTEKKKQAARFDAISLRVNKEKGDWVSLAKDLNAFNMDFVQHCILPRCTYTISDALYCARFVHLMHKVSTPNFSTLRYIDTLFKYVAWLVACSTEAEALRLGMFFIRNIITLDFLAKCVE